MITHHNRYNWNSTSEKGGRVKEIRTLGDNMQMEDAIACITSIAEQIASFKFSKSVWSKYRALHISPKYDNKKVRNCYVTHYP